MHNKVGVAIGIAVLFVFVVLPLASIILQGLRDEVDVEDDDDE